jgi:hypothetical protein
LCTCFAILTTAAVAVAEGASRVGGTMISETEDFEGDTATGETSTIGEMARAGETVAGGATAAGETETALAEVTAAGEPSASGEMALAGDTVAADTTGEATAGDTTAGAEDTEATAMVAEGPVSPTVMVSAACASGEAAAAADAVATGNQR